MKSIHNVGRLGLVAMGCSLWLSACTVETLDDQGSEGGAELGSAQSEIRSGTLTQKRGVVQVVFDGGGNCTGAMLNERYLLTSEDCVKNLLPSGVSTGNIEVWVRYYDPALSLGSYRFVTNNPETNPPGASEEFFTTVIGSMAVMRRTAGAFSGTSNSDYLRLSEGTCAQIDNHERFGAGMKGFSGEQDNLLRKSPVEVHECLDYWFYDLAGGDQTCKRDEGGPSILKAGSFDVIAGVFAGFQGDRNCAEGADPQVSARMVPWYITRIDEAMTGFTCTSFVQDGHPYRRCW